MWCICTCSRIESLEQQWQWLCVTQHVSSWQCQVENHINTVETQTFSYLPPFTTNFPTRRGLHQVRPPRHGCHGNGSESGGGACSGQGGQTDSAGEQAARATTLTLQRPARWHFKSSHSQFSASSRRKWKAQIESIIILCVSVQKL